MTKQKRERSFIDVAVSDMKRNDPCFCGSKEKYKSCHYMINSGWEKTKTGWTKKFPKLILPRAIK